MKKTIFTLAITLYSVVGISQWNPNGNSITSNIFRTGSVGIGYTTLPIFNPFKFKVNGWTQIESGTLLIGANNFYTYEEGIPNSNGANFWGIKSAKPIIVETSDPIYCSMEVRSGSNGFLMAMAKCNGCYSPNSKIGDAVLRGMTSGSLIITNDWNGDIKFETGDARISPRTTKVNMRIDNSGNIGIGMGNNPIQASDKLAVNGLIHAKEVKVDLLGWPDYVFTNNYSLPSLEEVEKSIIEKGHLINMPSANEIENHGLFLADISKKQQEKIEELTLYVIEQDKINKKQAKEIEELRQLLNTLIERK